MIKAAIFDCDGTLLDSMKIWDNVANDYLRSLGIEPRENLTETFKRFSMEEAAEYYQIKYKVTLSVKNIIEGIDRMVENFYLTEADTKDGVREFLEELKSRDVKMCVATATPNILIEKAFKRLGIFDYFRFIISCHDVKKSKNHPDIYEKALEKMGSSREETFVFEDSYHALKTAHNAGFPTISVYDKSESRQEDIKKLSLCHIESYRNLDEFRKAVSL